MPRCDLSVTYLYPMGGQVLSGGVIVFVAVALWLVYLLPSWQSRHRFTSAERNAVRLNQALRVLAETAETPREVHLELTARTAHQQQKLARQVQAQKAQTELAAAKARLEVAKLESARDRDVVKEQRAAAIEVARAERAAAVEVPGPSAPQRWRRRAPNAQRPWSAHAPSRPPRSRFRPLAARGCAGGSVSSSPSRCWPDSSPRASAPCSSSGSSSAAPARGRVGGRGIPRHPASDLRRGDPHRAAPRRGVGAPLRGRGAGPRPRARTAPDVDAP